MDSYRVEKKALMKIALEDTDAEIEPLPVDGGGRRSEPELYRLSNIIKAFNESFGTRGSPMGIASSKGFAGILPPRLPPMPLIRTLRRIPLIRPAWLTIRHSARSCRRC